MPGMHVFVLYVSAVSSPSSWLVPGVLCAAIYLVMSLPLGYLARRLEERWRMPGA